MKKTRAAAALVGAIVALALLVSACSDDHRTDAQKKGNDVAQSEQAAVQTGLQQQSRSQPIPVFPWSQVKQTLEDVERFQAEGTASTTMFYTVGVGLTFWCPSIGTPVPATYQLSSSKQLIDPSGDESRQLYEQDQAEPTGVYVGPTEGTYAICLDDNGSKFLVYWEGPAAATSGTLDLPADKRIQPAGVTFKYTEPPK